MSKPVIHWFHGESVAELKRRLNGADDPWLGVVLDAPHAPLLRVYPAWNENDAHPSPKSNAPDINDSHTCPPFTDCPPD